MKLRSSSTASLFAIVSVLSAVGACSPPVNNPDASPADAAARDAIVFNDAAANDAQSTPDAAASDVTGNQDSAATGMRATLPTGACFSFATGMFDMANPCTAGELYTLAGANVDLSSGGNTDTLCLLTGQFTALNDVPRDYASCMWTRYIEGIEGLTNRGMIVRNAAGNRHYRVRIISNSPTLSIEWDTID